MKAIITIRFGIELPNVNRKMILPLVISAISRYSGWRTCALHFALSALCRFVWEAAARRSLVKYFSSLSLSLALIAKRPRVDARIFVCKIEVAIRPRVPGNKSVPFGQVFHLSVPFR
jgi:hypothetical protein